MASFRFTKLKITAGYTLLLAILLFSLVFVHREMEALSAADDQQNFSKIEYFPSRRNSTHKHEANCCILRVKVKMTNDK